MTDSTCDFFYDVWENLTCFDYFEFRYGQRTDIDFSKRNKKSCREQYECSFMPSKRVTDKVSTRSFFNQKFDHRVDLRSQNSNFSISFGLLLLDFSSLETDDAQQREFIRVFLLLSRNPYSLTKIEKRVTRLDYRACFTTRCCISETKKVKIRGERNMLSNSYIGVDVDRIFSRALSVFHVETHLSDVLSKRSISSTHSWIFIHIEQ